MRWARVTAPGADADQFPVQQIEYLGKVANSFIVFPYGMHANVGADALALLFAVQGASGNKAAIAGSPQKRPKNLAAGEVVFYHPNTGSLIHFRTNGDLDIDTVKESPGNVNINVVQANITASDSVNITAPDTNITGDLDVSGDTTLGANVSSNGKDISDTHTHGGSPTAPDGAVSDTGAPV